MSHIVTIKTKLHDRTAILAACRRLKLPEPTLGTAKLYNADATGLLVQLPEWQYPAVIDTTAGTISYDNYGGSWGKQEHLDNFLQMYAVEKAKIEARKKGFQVSEQAMTDGSIKLQIMEA